MGFSIRRCQAEEAPTLAAFAARMFIQAYGPTHPEPDLTVYLRQAFDPARLAAELTRATVRILLAVDAADQLIGYAYLRLTEGAPPPEIKGRRPVEVLRFYVEQSWHGRGVAQALMTASEAVARQLGADALWLAVWQEAPRPIAFYRRVGLEVVGNTTFQFGSRTDADFLMTRALVHPAAPAETGEDRHRSSPRP